MWFYGKQKKRILHRRKKREEKRLQENVYLVQQKVEKPIGKFYKSYNPIHADGYIRMCKDCIIDRCFSMETQDVDVEELKKILRQIDKPFIDSIFQSSINQYNNLYGGRSVKKDNRKLIIGYYFKNLNSLHQFKVLNWEEGFQMNEKIKRQRSGSDLVIENTYQLQKEGKKYVERPKEVTKYEQDFSDFEVTDEIVRLFGGGFTKQEYKLMWDKYNFLKQSYPDFTTLHIESLVSYVRLKVKEELAIAKGDVDEATKWGGAASKAAEKAKINPSQLSQSELENGLSSFSELAQAVEQAVDIIPILPRFKFRPNDAIDFNIWCNINYLRKLEDKPLCEYEDVYKFYDERKAEYLEQYGDPYGIFTDDTTEKNREAIKKFIQLPSDYDDAKEKIEGNDVMMTDYQNPSANTISLSSLEKSVINM